MTIISEVDAQGSPHKMTFRPIDKQYLQIKMACWITSNIAL